jgi:hypothetical protein
MSTTALLLQPIVIFVMDVFAGGALRISTAPATP